MTPSDIPNLPGLPESSCGSFVVLAISHYIALVRYGGFRTSRPRAVRTVGEGTGRRWPCPS
ncbi:hypothetical protein [Streptomyces sp. NPDC101455]|uniref:hypothetical protein n=1 Tax=Streptomyces sp. NPDC101455 TaxID=3366142 RepID=UPI003814D75E